MRFGFCVPVFANPGAAYFRTPAWERLEPAAAVDAAIEAERLGYDAIWVADHLMHGVEGAILEGWTTLCVIAGRTERIRLGTIHLAQAFRHPGLIAKMASTLDVLSGGRLELFYDWGWVEREAQAFGFAWPEAAERIARVDEGLQLLEALWRGEDFAGRHHRTEGAVCLPRGERPRVWLGEAWHDDWCEVVARRADGWNSSPASPARYAEKLERVHAACRRVGRDAGELDLSLEVQVLVAPTERAVRETLARIAALPAPPRVPVREPDFDDWLIGTPAQVVEQLGRYRAIGVSEVMLWFVDFPSLEGMRLFAAEVAPCLR